MLLFPHCVHFPIFFRKDPVVCRNVLVLYICLTFYLVLVKEQTVNGQSFFHGFNLGSTIIPFINLHEDKNTKCWLDVGLLLIPPKYFRTQTTSLLLTKEYVFNGMNYKSH